MIKLFASRNFWAAYAGIMTLAFAAAVTAGLARGGAGRARELTVERINIVEPDGSVRMVISNKAMFPGLILRGKEYPHPNRKTAGILFFNDEATENGGLTFGGAKDKDGKVSSYGHLSFDRYEQDQVLVLNATEDGDSRRARLTVVDRPDYSVLELVELLEKVKGLPEEERTAEVRKFSEARGAAHPRLFLGRSDDRSVSLRLNDPEGRERLVVAVSKDGAPEIRFLDAEGKVVARLPAEDGK
jgi:hypothetical protein